MMKTLKDFKFKGKRVIVRTGFDVPLDKKGRVMDDARIMISVPTIKYLISKGAKQIIVMWHMGRPKGKRVSRLSTDKASAVLGKLLRRKVVKVDGWDLDCNDMIVCLENLRFNKAEKSKDKKERDRFGKQLASLADIYVNDAFSNCHRDHASITSVVKFIKGCAGLSVENEVKVISGAMKKPKRPLVSVIGGVKADKINAINAMLKRADKVLVGGALAFLLLKKGGLDVGKSKIDEEGLKGSLKNLLGNKKLVLPVDCVVSDRFDARAKQKVVDVDKVPSNMIAVDIGPKSVRLYSEIIKKAKTVIWNGPIGAFEYFPKGTKRIASVLAKSKAVTIVGGGDSAAAVDEFGVAGKMTHVSSGGGASLEMFEGKKLVGVQVLR